MARPLEYLFLHCSATPEGANLGRSWLERVHLGPRIVNVNGRLSHVVYKGRTYNNLAELPDETVGGQPIAKIASPANRGWDRFGYRALVLLDGRVERLAEANDDEWVQAGEITWGAGPTYNPVSHHVCYVGGLSADGKSIKDTRTDAQRKALEEIVRYYIEEMNPAIKVVGHNQVANKACPSFWVPRWLQEIGVSAANTSTKDPFGYARQLL